MRRKYQLELLDNREIDAADLRGNLRDLARLNRFTGTTAAILRSVETMIDGPHPVASQKRTLTIIDIGTGGGDLPTALTKWAARRNLPLVVLGADVHTGILDYARHYSTATGWLRLDGTQLSVASGGVDIAICTLLAHHLEPERLICLLAEMQRVSRIGFIVMDLERSAIAYTVLWSLTRLISRNPLTRHDGPLSIERAYIRSEVAKIAASAGISLHIRPIFPFRWIATWQAQ
jgi:2-polyprenyl-3-methyl-5-hydroxy-6-metoxy-1,4-benzoquinol methylase